MSLRLTTMTSLRNLRLLLFALLWSAHPAHAKKMSEATIVKCRSFLLSLARTPHSSFISQRSSVLQSLDAKLTELDYGVVIPWRPKEIDDLNRKLVRYHEVDELADPLPLYDSSQKLGPASVKVGEIRFSQQNAQNASEGGYTVISNARAFRDGSLKVEDLPRLQVWRDQDGRIWTLDHRRLAAMRLSGAVKDVLVEFVDEATVKQQRFKFDTKTQGRSIFVKVDEPGQEPMAIVVTNDQMRSLASAPGVFAPNLASTDEKVFIKLLSRYPATEQKAWVTTRGEAHLKRIRDYARELSDSLGYLEGKAKKSFEEAFESIGEVAVRGKSEGSILAKLLRKDFEAYGKNQQGITTLKEAVGVIGDGIGTRITINADPTGKLNPKSIQGFVDEISAGIKKGLQVTEIMNYRARNMGLPYLTDKQVEQLIAANQEYRRRVPTAAPLIVKNGPEASFETGYTSFHMNIKQKSGLEYEIQLRGAKINEAAEIQHFIYDLKSGKVLSQKLSRDIFLVAAEKAFKKLPTPDRERVMKYVERRLIYARKIEAGEKLGPVPKLDSDLPPILSFERLRPHLIHDE